MNFSICTRLLPGDPRGARFMGMTLDHERDLKAKHLGKIQELAAREVTPDEFSIRGMELCNDERDYYYSRFSREALQEIVELLPGAPVMRGHNYESLPVGVFFDARLKKREAGPGRPKRGGTVVEALYLLPNDDEGERMRNRIDLGIQREVSIGWRCAGADCSVCGDHIYACPHVPGDIYRKHGICEFQFSGITNVLEGSMVFRGGQKDTTTFVPEGGDGTAAAVAGAASRLMRAVGGDVPWDAIPDLKRNGARDMEALPNRVRAAIAQHARAQGWGLMCAEPGERSNTQALVFSGSHDVATAKRWARENDFRGDRVSSGGGSDLIATQFAESLAEPDSFELIKLEDDVRARICKKKAKEAPGSTDGASSLRNWFAETKN